MTVIEVRSAVGRRLELEARAGRGDTRHRGRAVAVEFDARADERRAGDGTQRMGQVRSRARYRQAIIRRVLPVEQHR